MTKVALSTQPKQASWAIQISKSLGLALSSVGIGWAVGRLWNGSGSIKGLSEIQSEKSIGRNPKIDTIFRQQYPESNAIPCSLGLVAGGAGTLLSANPLPLALGSSFCLPRVHAQSTLPDDTVFRDQTNRNAFHAVAEPILKVIAVGTAVATFPESLVLGTVAGGVGYETLGLLWSQRKKNGLIEESAQKNIQAFREEVARNPAYGTTAEQKQIYFGKVLVQDLADKKMDGNEIIYIKPILKNLQDFAENTLLNQERFTESLQNLRSEHYNLEGAHNRHVKATNALITEVGGLKQEYVKCHENLKALNSQMNKAEAGIKINAQEIKDLAKKTADSFDNVAKHLDQMNQRIETTSDLAQNTAVLTEHLVKQAMVISTQGFESSKKIMGLESELRELQGKGDLNGALGKVTALKQAMQEEQNNRVKFDQNLDGLASGFGILSLVAKATGNPKLANTISTVGSSAITIAKSIGALSGFGSAAASMTGGMAVLGPIGAIAGAAYAIFGLFMGGDPPIEQQILDAVKELSKQLETVRKEMHERFDRLEKRVDERFDHLEKMLRDHHKYVGARFDHLLKVMSQFHKQTIENFLEIKDGQKEIKALAQDIKKTLVEIEHKIDEKFYEIYKMQYETLKTEALRFHQLKPLPKKMSSEKWDEYFDKFSIWAEKGVANPIASGSSANKGFESVAKVVKAQGIEFNIQSLANLAHEQLQFQAFSKIPNPALWGDAVETFLEFLWRIPEHSATKDHKFVFDNIRNTGARFQEFVLALQSAPALYENLSILYRNSLRDVRDAIKQIVIKHVKQSVESFDEDALKVIARSVFPENLSKESKEVHAEGEQFIPQIKKDYPHKLTSGLTKLIPNRIYPFTDAAVTRGIENGFDWLEVCLKVITRDPKYYDADVFNLAKVVHTISPQLSEYRKKVADLSWYLGRLKHNPLPYLTDFETKLGTLNAKIQEFGKIEASKEQDYLNFQQAFKAVAQAYPKVKQIPDIERRLHQALKKSSIKDEAYLYLLHHLNSEERTAISAELVKKLKEPGTPLNKSVQEVDNYHVLLEAFIRLGFHQEFYQDIEFRKLFDNIPSADTLSSNILKWNVTNPEEMPYIQISDKALPSIEALRVGILDKITEHTLARNTSLEPSKQPTGHPMVDKAQMMLHLYEELFLKEEKQPVKEEKPTGKDEL